MDRLSLAIIGTILLGIGLLIHLIQHRKKQA